jgi:prepilin signal peptidase PulO-like enzyme (type II secretory pathway)
MLFLYTDFFIGWLFLLGSAIGSFLLVVADRYGTHENPFQGRSHCDYCGKKLAWFELIPCFSFLIQGGKCGSCKKKLSYQYLLFELVSGLLSVGILVQPIISGNNLLPAISMYLAACVLLVLIRIDAVSMMLPDGFIVGLTVLATISALLTHYQFENIALGVLVGAGFLYLLWIVTGGAGIGFGDVKLMIPLGILFGFQGSVTLLFISFFIGGLVGMWLLVTKKVSKKTAIPFGPFLAISAFLIMIAPDIPHRLFQLLGVE